MPPTLLSTLRSGFGGRMPCMQHSCGSQLGSLTQLTSRLQHKHRKLASRVTQSEKLTDCKPDTALLQKTKELLHFSETNSFSNLAEVLANDVSWRQYGLLQGSRRIKGAQAVHDECVALHEQYQDLQYTVNTYADEGNKLAVYWTATGVNRLSLFGRPATFKQSVFSGVTLIYADVEGKIHKIVEFRQPTNEEMELYMKDLSTARLQHLAPCKEPFCLIGDETIADQWRTRAVDACVEWVENWTACPDLDRYVREDVEELFSYSWPDFEADIKGRDALAERCGRSAQEAVFIEDTIADSNTSMVAVRWYDWRPVQTTPASSERGCGGAAAGHQSNSSSTSEHHNHGSVEIVDGHLKVHLSKPHKSSSSVDEGPAQPSHERVKGVTFFQLDPDCKIAWMVTFRELTAEEKDVYLKDPALVS